MSRGECLPNPKFDPISAIFWHSGTHTNNSQSELVDKRNGILFVLNKDILNDLNPDHSIAKSRFIQINSLSFPSDTEFVLFNNELEMFDAFVNLISLDIDPDFIVGYDVQKSSLGYITGIII
jgi:DNA polymerase elongation subunit (family B)